MGWLWMQWDVRIFWFWYVFSLPCYEWNKTQNIWNESKYDWVFNLTEYADAKRKRATAIGSAPNKPFYYKWNKATVCWSCSTFAISQSLVAEILAREMVRFFLWNCFLLNWRLTLDLPTTKIRKLYGTIKSNRCTHTHTAMPSKNSKLWFLFEADVSGHFAKLIYAPSSKY